ncbi:MAG: CBS domain-containing protein [Reyranella sp.]|nr:CBS domain-containing protein [Reyranella sp.]
MHAKDVMTGSVICINVGDSIFDAAELLLGARVSAVPVVDDKNAVVGIVSEADLVRRAEIGTAPKKNWLARLLASDVSAANDFAAAHTQRVADVMTKEVVTAGPDAPLRELVELMERHGIKRIPIVRDGALVGVVSRADLLCALLSREPDRPLTQPSDTALRQAVIEAVEKRAWSSRWPTHVFASGGVVDLWGFVDDDATRKAYGVAAENVPGVRGVNNHLRQMPASTKMGL